MTPSQIYSDTGRIIGRTSHTLQTAFGTPRSHRIAVRVGFTRPDGARYSPLPVSTYDRLTESLEWPIAILALAVIPALLLDNGSETPRVHLLAMSVNWFVWLAFCTCPS